jgi:hypothetical protein
MYITTKSELYQAIYLNGCDAAKGRNGYNEDAAQEIGDTNYDCKVNLVDFAVMASNWLTDVSLSR